MTNENLILEKSTLDHSELTYYSCYDQFRSLTLLVGGTNDWINLVLKFASKCKTCGNLMPKGENAMWSRSAKAVKHIECHSNDLKSLSSPDSIHNLQLKCVICSKPAGCPACEFEEDCDRRTVSQLCICEECFHDPKALENYYREATKLIPKISPQKFKS
jgi:hypothetical protein